MTATAVEKLTDVKIIEGKVKRMEASLFLREQKLVVSSCHDLISEVVHTRNSPVYCAVHYS